jgi:hypothetical protein
MNQTAAIVIIEAVGCASLARRVTFCSYIVLVECYFSIQPLYLMAASLEE